MRCLHVALAVLAAPFLPLVLFSASAGPPNFSGAWQLNAAKSQAVEGQAIALTIQDSSGKINFTRVVRDKDGKEETSQFACQTGGNQCDFDESGRKAKVSLWYDGPSLQILKTDGPKEDAVTQWSLKLSPDGNTLTIELDHIDPTDKKQTMVFDKKPS